jgi:hypothetical protein
VRNAFQHRQSVYGEEQILHDFIGWVSCGKGNRGFTSGDVKSMRILALRAENAKGKDFIAYKKGHTRSAAFLFSER